MKVKALITYNDSQLSRQVIAGEAFEVSEERAKVLLNGNESSNYKPFVEILEDTPKKETTKTNTKDMETADKKIEDIETTVVIPKKKKEEEKTEE